MTPLPHRYAVRLAGSATGHATLAADGLPELRTAPPLEFDGPGDAWSPEHLLLAAVQACFLFTLRGVARASGIEFLRCEVEAEGIVDRTDRVMRFTEIVLRPRLALGPTVDRARARRAVEKAEHACLVSASLVTPVRLELEFLEPESTAHEAELEARNPMQTKKRKTDLESVVAIGLSADGLHAIRTVLGGLPAGFHAPILVVLHRAPQAVPRLAQVIGRACALPVKEAAPFDVLERGHVYIAPPDAHLVVDGGHLQLEHTERVAYARPSIDVLFKSVANTYGPRAVGVIMSGAGSDGARGLQAIRAGGGATIVQDPEDARFARLPKAAIDADGIDFRVPLSEISPTILAIVERRREPSADEISCETEAVQD